MIVIGVTLVLAWVIFEDARRYRIRNAAIAILVAAFILDCAVGDRLRLLVPHALLALFGLAVMAGAFRFGLVGGGDAKLLPAALFWVGPEGAFVFALALMVATLLYGAGAALRILPRRMAAGRMVVPFGSSIAAAWLAVLALTSWAGSGPPG